MIDNIVLEKLYYVEKRYNLTKIFLYFIKYYLIFENIPDPLKYLFIFREYFFK